MLLCCIHLKVLYILFQILSEECNYDFIFSKSSWVYANQKIQLLVAVNYIEGGKNKKMFKIIGQYNENKLLTTDL